MFSVYLTSKNGLKLVITILLGVMLLVGPAWSQTAPMHNRLPMVMLTPGLYYASDLPATLPTRGLVMCGTLHAKTRLTEGNLTFKPAGGANNSDEVVITVINGCSDAQNEKPWLFLADKSGRLAPQILNTLSRPYFNPHDRTPLPTGKPLSDIPFTWRMAGKTYTLELNQPAGSKRYRLVLQSENIRQILAEHPAPSGKPNVEVLWAGDMDGDNRLDLMTRHPFETQHTYARVLFLSSFAQNSQLLAPVAQTVESAE